MTNQTPLSERLKDIVPAPQAQLDKWLDQAKGRLFTMKGAGFLGSLLCNHRIIWDENCPTGWCDGSTIGLSPRFFTYLNRDTRVTLLVHELWHTGYDHMTRLAGRDPRIWNMAADYVINNDMVRNGFSFEGMNGLIDPAYDNMTTEEVYHKLIEEGVKPPPCAPGPGDPGDGKAGEGGTGNQGNIPDLSGDLREPTEEGAKEIMSKIVQAAQASRMSKEAGVIPGETELHIDEFLNPVLPWDTLLHKYMNELSNDDYSWKRPSRRYEDEYLPSLQGENGLEHLIYYLDISGSVSDEEIKRFNSEVKFIHESLAPKRLTLVTFDTKIQDVYEFEEDDVFEKIVVHGRGGTSLDCVQKHIVKHMPTAAVVFSDLFCYPMTPDPRVPVLWIIVDNKKAKTNFGTNIHMERHQV